MTAPVEVDPDARRTAVAWVRAVMDERDLRAAWPLTEADLRLVLVQHWVLSHHEDEDLVGGYEGWPALAAGLAADPPVSALWDRFADERLKRWRQYWAGFSARTWDLRDEPELPRPGLEVVTFIEPGRKLNLKPGAPITFRRLAIRRQVGQDAGWLVAGVDGTNLFRPGWPPGPV
ncbi:MAG: hypothetical protein ABIW46_09525 [Acidimicrobiales bacterium]